MRKLFASHLIQRRQPGSPDAQHGQPPAFNQSSAHSTRNPPSSSHPPPHSLGSGSRWPHNLTTSPRRRTVTLWCAICRPTQSSRLPAAPAPSWLAPISLSCSLRGEVLTLPRPGQGLHLRASGVNSALCDLPSACLSVSSVSQLHSPPSSCIIFIANRFPVRAS